MEKFRTYPDRFCHLDTREELLSEAIHLPAIVLIAALTSPALADTTAHPRPGTYCETQTPTFTDPLEMSMNSFLG
jgi:hypothetical protein